MGLSRPDRRGGWLSPQRLRQRLTGASPVLVQVGRFLALRPDLLAPGFARELLRLPDQGRPRPWRDLRSAAGDTGLDEAVDSVEPQPVVVTSLFQVYRGRLKSGLEIAIKVLPADVDAEVRAALEGSTGPIDLLSGLADACLAPAHRIAGQFKHWLEAELDLPRQLEMLRSGATLAARIPGLTVPRTCPTLSGRRVLTTQFLDGMPLASLLRLVTERGAAQARALGFDLPVLADRLYSALLDQIFGVGVLCFEPWAGDLLAGEDNTLVVQSCAHRTLLGAGSRPVQVRYLGAVAAGDAKLAWRELMGDLPELDPDRREALRQRFLGEVALVDEEPSAGTPSGTTELEPQLARRLTAALRAAWQEEVELPQDVVALHRALILTETIAGILDPDPQDERRSELQAALRRAENEDMLAAIAPDRLRRTAGDWLASLEEVPGAVRHLVTELADDRFVLQVRTTESRRDRVAADTRARMSTSATLSISIAVLLVAAQALAHWARILLSLGLGASLLFLYVRVILLWRRLS